MKQERGTVIKNGHVYRHFGRNPYKVRLYHACKRFGNPCNLPDDQPTREEGMKEL